MDLTAGMYEGKLVTRPYSQRAMVTMKRMFGCDAQAVTAAIGRETSLGRINWTEPEMPEKFPAVVTFADIYQVTCSDDTYIGRKVMAAGKDAPCHAVVQISTDMFIDDGRLTKYEPPPVNLVSVLTARRSGEVH